MNNKFFEIKGALAQLILFIRFVYSFYWSVYSFSSRRTTKKGHIFFFFSFDVQFVYEDENYVWENSLYGQ